MKKILEPACEEDAIYYSDFSGKLLDSFINAPPCELKINFNYGSIYDGENLTLHLTDDEAKSLLEYIKLNLTEEAKKEHKGSLFFMSAEGGEVND